MGDVRYERRDRIGHIVLDRPSKLNALTDDGVVDLRACLEAFDDDDAALVGVMWGRGRAFSSGADVGQRQARSREEIERLGGLQPRNTNVRTVFGTQVRHKPVVAAVHGFVLGAALWLALYCDLLVAAEGTIFQVTEVARGLDAGGLWALIRDRVGASFADDVCVTGRRWTAEEAASHGLLTTIAPNGRHVEVAERLAADVVRNPPLAVRNIVRIRRGRLDEIEVRSRSEADRNLIYSDDFRESVSAFMEGRSPTYRGA